MESSTLGGVAPETNQIPSINVGGVRVTRIFEGGVEHLPATFFATPAQPTIEKNREYLPAGWTDSEGFPVIRISAFVLSVNGINVLVDACVGDWQSPARNEHTPKSDFFESLKRAGVAREDIDVVVITHMHFDHVGGLTYPGENNEPELAFPNARHYFGEYEWNAQSQKTMDLNSPLCTVDQTVRPILECGAGELVSSDREVAPGISYAPSPGHTLGHLCVTISSEGKQGVILGDMAHHPVQLLNPELGSAFDDDRNLSTETRTRLIAEWVESGTTILGTHFPGTGFGRMTKSPSGVVYYSEADL